MGNVRLVADATAQVVEESDYLPFGTENVITSTITNNYKFVGMERDTEGNAALDHTLYREYAPNLARWTTPDPVHGTPANPQSWNRYPYVLNDPLTKIDPLGNSPDWDPYLVGCFPDYTPFFLEDFGCGWDDESECPPGYVPIYGDFSSYGEDAIANMDSLLDYAGYRLDPYAVDYGGFLTYGPGPDGVTVNFFSGVGGSINLASLAEIKQLGDLLDTVVDVLKDVFRKPNNDCEVACYKRAKDKFHLCWESIVVMAAPIGTLIPFCGAGVEPDAVILCGAVLKGMEESIDIGGSGLCAIKYTEDLEKCRSQCEVTIDPPPVSEPQTQ